jgi:competence protein ComFC
MAWFRGVCGIVNRAHRFKGTILQRLEEGLRRVDSVCLWCGASIQDRAQVPKRAVVGDISAARPWSHLCHTCAQEVPWIVEIDCSRCGRFESCPDCNRRAFSSIGCNRSAVRYTPQMKLWLARWKYRGHERLAPLFQRMMDFAYFQLQHAWRAEGCFPERKRLTIFSYVPLSTERWRERGFNQAQVLAEGLSRCRCAPLVSLLSRNRHTGKQSLKSRSARQDNLEGAFVFEEAVLPEVYRLLTAGSNKYKALHVVIVDDVYTTGSTLQQCGLAVAQALNQQVQEWGIQLRIDTLTWAR